MINPQEQVISCTNESGSLVTVIKATRQSDPDTVDAPLTVIYYTVDGYLVELLSDGNFEIALTHEKLTRVK
ncbi:hypothetical protein [Neorhizobium sp. T25_27]|uniref:hypothetical protein n=1 Tax=Neorhizobium sp. T25_27 TaxID=2093831 RepID=UPI000CF91DD5|nr:hypothetical protein [Neorhizobium sp. T25_27]